jgi:large repetitive protein
VTFTDADPKGSLSQYSGTINWGDGTATGGTFATNPSGGFAFGGAHTYPASGTYKITVTIHDVGGASASATTSMVVP